MHKKQGFALPRRTLAGKTFQSNHEIEPMAATGPEKSPDSAGNSGLAARLSREITGDVFFDAFNRGRYATDASFYQIMPLGVVVPRTMDEARRALAIAGDAGRIVTPRGGGTSQCGQTVNEGIVKPVEQVLRLIPDLNVETIESSCCGMAGAFGYGADTYQASMEMAELSLLPAVCRADQDTLIVADGTSCRHQIKDGTERSALHVARVLAISLDRATSNSTAFSIAKEPIHG